MTLYEFIVVECGSALERQNPDGSFPHGVNGPYGHPEKRVRNTGHWLMSLAFAYKRTGDIRFMNAMKRAAEFVLQEEHRPGQATVWHRTTAGRDRCNGLIGQAWSMEALMTAARYDVPGAFDLARRLWELHPFEKDKALWKRVEVDGKVFSRDMTFNHQLWFAAVVAELGAMGVAGATGQAAAFMDALPRWFRVDAGGLIQHRIRTSPFSALVEAQSPFHRLWDCFDRGGGRSGHRLNPTLRDVGYHAFNLAGLARLAACFPDHAFWKSSPFRKAIDFGRSDAHVLQTQNNPYAYPYNPVGFETALALQTFRPELEAECQAWIARQASELLHPDGYGSHADDPETARARLYEATFLKDAPWPEARARAFPS